MKQKDCKGELCTSPPGKLLRHRQETHTCGFVMPKESDKPRRRCISPAGTPSSSLSRQYSPRRSTPSSRDSTTRTPASITPRSKPKKDDSSTAFEIPPRRSSHPSSNSRLNDVDFHAPRVTTEATLASSYFDDKAKTVYVPVVRCRSREEKREGSVDDPKERKKKKQCKEYKPRSKKDEDDDKSGGSKKKVKVNFGANRHRYSGSTYRLDF